MDKYTNKLTEQEKREIMLKAVSLAENGRGQTAPNPCVGALITRKGEIVGQSWHKRPGGKHAEVGAIEQARRNRVDLTSCTLWVTLEPCNHLGRTPPCTKAILDAGIDHVIVGVRDPNQKVAGGGLDYLRKVGIAVEEGIAKAECLDCISDFITWQLKFRPYVYLKLASTLDGKIASRDGTPLSISCEQSWHRVHQLRSMVQAVLVGGNTFYADDPWLTARIGQETEKQPLAVVATSRLPAVDANWKLLSSRPGEVIFLTTAAAGQEDRKKALREIGASVWELAESGGDMDFGSALQRLYKEHACYYLLCEGGGRLALSLMEQGLVDRFFHILNPRILGDEKGVDMFSGSSRTDLKDRDCLRILKQENVGEDFWLTLAP